MPEIAPEAPQKVYVGFGKFFHDQRPAAHTERIMKQYDEKLIPKLHGTAAEIAQKIRRPVETYAKIAGVYQTTAEAVIAVAGLLGAVALGKSINLRHLKMKESMGRTKAPEPIIVTNEQYLFILNNSPRGRRLARQAESLAINFGDAPARKDATIIVKEISKRAKNNGVWEPLVTNFFWRAVKYDPPIQDPKPALDYLVGRNLLHAVDRYSSDPNKLPQTAFYPTQELMDLIEHELKEQKIRT